MLHKILAALFSGVLCLLLALTCFAMPETIPTETPMPPPEPDRTRLEQLIATMQTAELHEGNYTIESLMSFRETLDLAISIHKDPEATEQMLYDVAQLLKNAYYTLEPVFHLDTAELQRLTEEITDFSPYLSDSALPYRNAVTEARVLLERADLTPYDIAQAENAIRDAKEKLIPKPDKKDLQAYLTALQDLERNASLYTETSILAIQSASAQLEAIRDNPEADAETVATALEIYQTAVRSVSLKPLEQAEEPSVFPLQNILFGGAGVFLVLAITLSIIFFIKFRKKT